MYFTTPITINHHKNAVTNAIRNVFNIVEILETQTTSTKADVHPIPPDVVLDLEVKLEQEEQEGEEKEEEGEVEEIEAESSASALLLLSKPKAEFEPSRFTSLWVGIFIIHNFLTALSVLCVLN